MTVSIKETLDRLYGVNPPPAREISLEEMLKYREESRERLQKREKRGRKQGTGKEGAEDAGNPCPACGITHWSVFPDGRKYCLSCGAVMEVDGTVTGGAIKKEIKNKEENIMIEGELKCEKCGKVQPFSATEKELMEFIKQPHKNCGGRISFNIVKEESKGNESKHATKPKEQSIEYGKITERIEPFSNKKVEGAICSRCDYNTDCPKTFQHLLLCLISNIDYKMKKHWGL